MTPIDRTIDFRNVISVIPDSDFTAAGASVVENWLNEWGNYIAKGGDRPPVNPHHP